MKKLLTLVSLTFSGLATQAAIQGQASVIYNQPGALIMIDGEAADALYDGMLRVKSSPIEGGARQGFLKAGENIACTRSSESDQWLTRCTLYVKQIETGEIANSKD